MATDWTSRITERDLESRLHEVELTTAELKRTIEYRCQRVKSEIETQIWEDRAKAMFVVSIGVAVVAWAVAIASWLR